MGAEKQMVLHVKSIGHDGTTRLIRNGDVLSFSELLRGLRITCSENVESGFINHAACQVTLEVPFPMSRQDMIKWGPEIVGYTPLILDAHVYPESDVVCWMPSPVSIQSLEKQLTRRMHDFVWDDAGTLTASLVEPDNIGTDEQWVLYKSMLTTKDDLQYLCLDYDWSNDICGLIYNWKGDAYDAVLLQRSSQQTTVVTLRSSDKGIEVIARDHGPSDDGPVAYVSIKAVTDGLLFDGHGVRGQVPTQFERNSQIGVIGGTDVNRLVAVYPWFVENACFPSYMIEGHYQDERTLARVVVKPEFLTRRESHPGPVPDFQLFFYLSSYVGEQRSDASSDPYRSTDGHPSIGGHLLFEYGD